MKKIVLTAFALLSLSFGLRMAAGPVSADRALGLAGQIMPAVSTRAAAEPLKVLWDGETAAGVQAPALYVIGRESGGFVIIAGDDRVCPVLAISDREVFRVEGMPANVRWWMERMKAYVRSVGTPEERAVEAWSAKTRASTILPDAGVTNRVEKLTPKWDQGNSDVQGGYFDRQVYNAKCPMYGSQYTVTGCVATALGEVLAYESGQSGVVMPSAAHGTVGDYTEEWGFTGNMNPVDYGYAFPAFPYVLGVSYDYDWQGLRSLTDYNAIRAAINAGRTDLIENLGQLLADLGAIVHARYSVGGTSASLGSHLLECCEYLGINKQVYLLKESDYSKSIWVNKLKAELDLRPVLYSGSGNHGGHQFVFDGYGTYEDETVFHVNFGWMGFNNGYYRYLSLDTGDSGYYHEGCEAIFSFYPDATTDYVPSLSFMSAAEASRNGCQTGLATSPAFSAGTYFRLYVRAVQNAGIAPVTGVLRVIKVNRFGEATGSSLLSTNVAGLSSGGYFPEMSKSNLRINQNQISFGDRLVAQYALEGNANQWFPLSYVDDGNIIAELPLMPAAFIRTEASYAVGDYFMFRLKNNNTLYAGTVWTVTAPNGVKTVYQQADKEFCLTQTGKYKIDAAIAEEVGGTVSEHVVAVINVQ